MKIERYLNSNNNRNHYDYEITASKQEFNLCGLNFNDNYTLYCNDKFENFVIENNYFNGELLINEIFRLQNEGLLKLEVKTYN